MVENLQERREEVVAHLSKTFPSLSESDILLFLEKSESETSLDDGMAHALFLERKALVERAALGLSFDLFGGVSAGYLDSDGLSAMQQRVMMTDASVILISDSLGMMGIWLSKLLAKSIPFEHVEGGFQLNKDIAASKECLLKCPELQAQWNWFFYAHARWRNTEVPRPIIVSHSDEENTLWSDLSEAIDLFVLSHEYGHHIAAHSLNGVLSVEGEGWLEAHRKELEADHLAARLCCEAGQDLEEPNLFAVSNVRRSGVRSSKVAPE